MCTQTQSQNLQSSVLSLSGVGPKRAQALGENLGIWTIKDLIYHLPRKYHTPGKLVSIAEMPERVGEQIRIKGEVAKTWTRGFGRRAVVCVRLEDQSGHCTVPWFHQPYLKNAFPIGRQLHLEGRVAQKNGVQLHSPHIVPEDLDLSRLQPEYPDADGIPSHLLEKLIDQIDEVISQIDEPLPGSILELANVPFLKDALQSLHRPKSLEEVEQARRRLAWAEVLRLELRRLRSSRNQPSNEVEITPPDVYFDSRIWEKVLARIPFALTPEQVEVLQELRQDLAAPNAMSRLLHGEVGSGKTVIAFAIALLEAAAGKQTAILAPTEILARQHLTTFRSWLKSSKLTVAGLFGDDTPSERRLTTRLLSTGQAQIAIGTHALLSEEVKFKDLNLIVFDEQHRFGVRQKSKLVEKAKCPQVLTMSATPIPRTMAWAQYGAVKVSQLSTRPGSGGEVKTEVQPLGDFKKWASTMRPLLEAGERCFVVAPHIDGPDGLLKIASELRHGAWRGLQMEVVHGRLPGQEVLQAVQRFRDSKSQVLLGTTMVEVGLDVPGIKWMAVVQAQRLGLASLHQLRGRLSRGKNANGGTCVLFAEEESTPRLEILCAHSDGFSIAAADLAERGPGALKGLKQHGKADFHLFCPSKDQDLVELLRLPEVGTWLNSID